MAKDKGLIHIYCGENKGKTTACVGQAVRAFGSGFKVIFCQFLKTSPSGELKSLEQLGIKTYRITKPKGFTWEMNEEELKILKEEHNKLFKEVTSLVEGDGDKTLLVLDELVGAYVGGHIDKDMVMDFLNNFKDFFAVFFESALSFSDFILYFSSVFAVGLIVKIFNKVRFGKC